MPESLGAEGVADWYRRKQEQQRERAAKRPPDWRQRARRVWTSARYVEGEDRLPVLVTVGGVMVHERLPGEPTRKERRARPSVGTNQPRAIRVLKFGGEPCKWPQMAHVEMERVR